MVIKVMRCKNCREKFEPIRFNHKYCLKDECIKAFVEEVKANQWKTTKKRMKEDLKTLQDWLKEAQTIFNKYIRLRDMGLPCVSCGQPPKKRTPDTITPVVDIQTYALTKTTCIYNANTATRF